MWGIVLLIFFVTGSLQLSIKEFSVPNAAKSGEDVLLQCRYELTSGETDNGLMVKWWFTPLNGSDDKRIQLYQRIAGLMPPLKTRDNIDLIKGNDDIILRNVTPKNSGTYECQVSGIEDEKRQHDSLIVFTKGGLTLNITEVEDGPDEDEEKDILVTCEAIDVAPFPVLQITVNDEEMTSNDTVLLEENSTFDVITIIQLSREKAVGAKIGCELFFRNVNITHAQYKITQTFISGAEELTTTKVFEAASTTEATVGNRVIGTASSLLLVISVIFISFRYLNYSL